MVKFGLSQVLTQLSEHLQLTKSSSTNQSSRVKRSATQVMKDLKYTIPRLDPASDVQSTSKQEATTKANDEDKQKVEIDDKGFKIQQGTAHRNKKKLEADQRQKVVEWTLDREKSASSVSETDSKYQNRRASHTSSRVR